MLAPYSETIATVLQLVADPTYDPEEGYTWWNKHGLQVILNSLSILAGVVMLAMGNPGGVLMILSGAIGIVGAVVSEQLAGAASMAMLAIQTIAIGVKCLKCCTPYGIIALAVGAACVAFATSETQEALGYGNWMKDLGMSDGWYTGLMVTANVAAIAINLVGVKQCFKEGTLVQTEEGLKPIEEIQVGDKVLAYDEETGEQEYKPVLRLFRNTSQDWTGVTVNGEEIISTPKHKYYLPESKSWKSAEELKVGTKVLLTDGSYGIIEAVKAIHYDKLETTYNFEVADFHTYYVGTGVLVHNRGCNSLKPDYTAKGDHTTFTRDSSGKITHYATYEKNPMNPVGFDEVLRFDGVGGSHFNKVTKLDVPTPHIHGKSISGGVGVPMSYQLPRGY